MTMRAFISPTKLSKMSSAVFFCLHLQLDLIFLIFQDHLFLHPKVYIWSKFLKPFLASIYIRFFCSQSETLNLWILIEWYLFNKLFIQKKRADLIARLLKNLLIFVHISTLKKKKIKSFTICVFIHLQWKYTRKAKWLNYYFFAFESINGVTCFSKTVGWRNKKKTVNSKICDTTHDRIKLTFWMAKTIFIGFTKVPCVIEKCWPLGSVLLSLIIDHAISSKLSFSVCVFDI